MVKKFKKFLNNGLPMSAIQSWNFFFSDWVKSQVAKRNKEMLQEKGLIIEMDCEMAAAF